jgi:hypothetical protein
MPSTLLEQPETVGRTDQAEKNTWSGRQLKQRPLEKALMGRHCAAHEFLVSPGSNPETASREKLASILVTNGTSPVMAVKECMDWVVSNTDARGPFDLTWYTTGTLVPSTLKDYRDKHPMLAAAMHLFLFPGRVDQQMEAVSGPDPVDFAERMTRCFRYAFLGAHSFEMSTGTAYFHLPEEVRLQKACATRYAAQKFLFLDSGKLRREGEVGYQIDEILETAEGATIYTVATEPATNARVKREFQRLCERTFMTPAEQAAQVDQVSRKRTLRLVIVGRDESPSDCTVNEGLLRTKVIGL